MVFPADAPGNGRIERTIRMKIERMSRFALVALGVLLVVTVVQAQPLARAFVSAQTGSDSNPCTPTAPCRTFNKALTTIISGGEVVVLTSGGYGPATVTDAV